MEDGYGMVRNSTRSDENKDRSIQEYLETPSKYCILVQLGVCPRERSAILQNTAERHFYVATRAERIQNSKHWSLTLNAEGPQQPLNQRPDFAQAKRECTRLHDEHLARTQEDFRTIPRSQQVRQRKGQPFEGIEETTTRLTLKQDGGSAKGRGEACRQLRQGRGVTCRQLCHRRQIVTEPIGRRAI